MIDLIIIEFEKHIVWTQALSWIYRLQNKIFPSLWLTFCFINYDFEEQMFLILMKSILSMIFFYSLCFGAHPMAQKFSSVFQIGV